MTRLDRVLLIDDDRFEHLACRRVLKKAPGIGAVLSFEMGREALTYLSGAPPARGDVIFLDVNMPAMTGFEFLEAARAQFGPDLGGALVIFLTTSLNPSDRDRAAEIPVIAAFETKPLTLVTIERARLLMEDRR